MAASTESLPATGVLAGVSAASREALASYGAAASYGKGATVVEQDVISDGLHIVITGELMVTLHTPEELLPLSYVQPGETVGEMGFLEPGSKASAKVTAHVPSVVWEITPDRFEDFLTAHPEAGCEILKAILRLVGRRARKGNERLADETDEGD